MDVRIGIHFCIIGKVLKSKTSYLICILSLCNKDNTFCGGNFTTQNVNQKEDME